MEPVKPRRVVGRYALFDEIASGGMATVHYGRLLGPVGFSRTVAIKRLHPEYARDPEFVSMFVDEARLAARIRHPNVVPTLDVIAEEGELFLVMDYVLGAPLSAIMFTAKQKNIIMPPRIGTAILSGCLQGLHAAHEATDESGVSLGIVHRDVSPQNILVGADGVPRVLDFGIAKASGRTYSTRDGSVKGKVAYMAPEQMESGVVTRQADLYAATVVLWEALTGQRAFTGDTEAIVWMRAAAGKLPLPSSVHPDLAPYDAIVARGMARDTTERYDSARQMALDLERCAGTSSQAELSAWLESVIAPVLDQRSQMVSSIESFSGVSVSDVREMIESDLSVTSDVTSPHSAAAALSTRIQVPRPHSSHPPPAGDGTGVPVAVPSAAALPRFDEKRSSPSLLVLAVVLPLVLVGAAAAALWWPGGSMGPGEVVEDDGARDSPASPLPSARSDSTDQTSDPVVGSSVAGADPSVASSVSATASALDSAESTATAPTPVVPLAPNTSGAPSAPAPSASSKGAFDELGGRL